MTCSPPLPHTPSPARASLTGRQRAAQLAALDTAQALAAARGCPDAWYRVQALASVAVHAAAPEALAILDEAARESRSCPDVYGTVAVMAWPIAVALRLGCFPFADRELARVLALAPSVEPAASRAFALQTLWSGCFAAAPRHAGPVWATIQACCPPDRHWRAARLYRHVAERSEAHQSGAAARVLRAMPEGPARRKLARRLGLA
ncbi:MAG: hypothetical protein H7312_20085 [Tardiphaga sp.]|nr:hypothetical protein [Tardiphaga sp.]